MLIQHIQSKGIDPQSHDGKILIEECVMYLAGVTDAFHFQRAVKAIDLTPTGMSGKDFRLGLQAHSYLTLNVKYAALFLGLMPNNADTYAKLQKFLCATDVREFRNLFARRKLKARVKQSAALRRLTIHDVSYMAMRKHKSIFDHYITKVGNHIKRKVFQKLRFLVKAENQTLKDFHSDVLCKVLRAYHQLVPTKEPEAYILNYMRAAANKHIVNIIEFYTTNKRQRMVSEGVDEHGNHKGFSLVCESDNQHASAQDDYTYENVASTVSTDEARKVEDNILFERLRNRFDGRKRAAVEIMAGVNDDRFTNYLRERGSLKEGDDHADYQRRVAHTTFLNAIADYLGVVREAFMKFVNKIGTMLTAHKEYA